MMLKLLMSLVLAVLFASFRMVIGVFNVATSKKCVDD